VKTEDSKVQEELKIILKDEVMEIRKFKANLEWMKRMVNYVMTTSIRIAHIETLRDEVKELQEKMKEMHKNEIHPLGISK
jgi:hypothetical protein